MILYNIVKEQIEVRWKRRLQKAEERGRAEGIIEEGIVEGAEGKAHAQKEWREWLESRETAEAAGDPFNDPSPD